MFTFWNHSASKWLLISRKRHRIRDELTLKRRSFIFVKVDAQDLALSTSLFNNLSEIFNNLTDVKWRLLKSLYNTGSDYVGFTSNVVGKVSKFTGSSVDYVNRGLGYAKDLTGRSFDYVTSGLQSGVGYVSNGLNSFGSTAENYGRRLSSGSKSSSSR